MERAAKMVLVALLALTVIRAQVAFDRDQRIVGGTVARPNQFPHAVALVLHQSESKSSFCGASIIHPAYLLTAAHCMDNVTRVEVQAGIQRIFRGTPQYRAMVETRDVRIHSQYNSDTLLNDIALIFLLRRIPFNSAMQQIALPPRSSIHNRFTAQTGTIIGWGRFTDASEHLSDELRFVSLAITSDRHCQDVYNAEYSYFRSSNICVSGARGSSCNGDSGGSMHIIMEGKMTAIGIVSYGSSTCESGHPPVMTRITSYLDWIAANTGIRIL